MRDDPTPDVAPAERWRGILDRLPLAVGVLTALRDPDGEVVDFQIVHANHEACRDWQLPEPFETRRLAGLTPASAWFEPCREALRADRAIERRVSGVQMHLQRDADGVLASWRRTAGGEESCATLVASTTHDLRNSLGAILLDSQYLRVTLERGIDEASRPQTVDCALRVERQARRIRDLVEHLAASVATTASTSRLQRPTPTDR